MRFAKFFFLMVPIVMLMGCGKDNDDDDTDDRDDVMGIAVVVSGQMDASASEAMKVVAYSSTGRYEVVEISAGSFSVTLDNGKPWGLVFTNVSGQYLGHLTLGDGIDALPLHYLNQGVSAVALGTISQNGLLFTPSNNPIGTSIPLSAEQMVMVASADDYLSSIMNNPDVDGNGIVDVIEGRFFQLSVIYFINPGNFQGANLTPTAWQSQRNIYGYKLFLTVEDQSYPENVAFSGPVGSQLSSTISNAYMSFSDSRVYPTPFISDVTGLIEMYPPGGTYTINYAGTTLSFTLADQSYVVSNIVYPWPTMLLNGDGALQSMNWNYEIPFTTVATDVSAVMRTMQIQIDGSGTNCAGEQVNDRIYNTEHLNPSVTSHTFTCQTITWGTSQPTPMPMSHIDRVMMTYRDHYDASYVVMYERSW